MLCLPVFPSILFAVCSFWFLSSIWRWGYVLVLLYCASVVVTWFAHRTVLVVFWANAKKTRRLNHALQRTRPSRSGCNPRVLRAGSLSFRRSLRREVASTTAERGLVRTQPCL